MREINKHYERGREQVCMYLSMGSGQFVCASVYVCDEQVIVREIRGVWRK